MQMILCLVILTVILGKSCVSSTSRTQGEDDHDGAAKGKVSRDVESAALSESSEQPYLADHLRKL